MAREVTFEFFPFSELFSPYTLQLPSLIQSNFPVLADKQSVFGHR